MFIRFYLDVILNRYILFLHALVVYFLKERNITTNITFLFNDLQVVTFWEGEIVDTKNYTFFTGKWEAAYVVMQ